MRSCKIACLTLLKSNIDGTDHASLPDCEVQWDTVSVPPNLPTIKEKLHELSGQYDAVALDGITSIFRIGKATYRYEYLWHHLGLDKLGNRFADGSGLRTIIERCLVRSAADQLQPHILDKHILLLSGLNRYGSAEVLSGYSRDLLFGDLLYGFRLGVPIKSIKGLVRAAPRLARTVSLMPAQWYWPSARTSGRVMPRFASYFRWADVIVGGRSYFERYEPADLTGKVIFTNIYSTEDFDFFQRLNAKAVVSLTPNIGGKRVPLPVLEAAMGLTASGERLDDSDDAVLNQLLDLKLKPEISLLEQDPIAEIAAHLPPNPPAEMKPVAVPSELKQEKREVGKFCFVVHPLSFSQAKRIKAVRLASHFAPARVIEDAIARAPHFPVGFVKDVTSLTGDKAEGILYGLPMTSKAIMRHPPEFLYRKLLQIADDAAEAGCRIMGLGAFTSVAGDAGLTVSRKSPIAVTSGNSFTVASTLKTMRIAAAMCGIDLSRSTAVVIGATGSIGSICTRLLADEVDRVYCVSPRPERLAGLVEEIWADNPDMFGRVKAYRSAAACIHEADVVISTTSQVGAAMSVANLKPGCLICDVARPADIDEEEARTRDDILVIESGEILLPEGSEITYDIGLPPGIVYACLAETILLALDGRFEHFTVGRKLSKEKVRLIEGIGEKHGLGLADIRSFGKVVPEEHFARLAAINSSRFETTLTGSG